MVVALCASAAWWFVRAPMIVGPAASPPAIDIDPPAMRARREAAIALATMPDDDPWTFAETLAAPASAPDQPVVKEHCGVEDGPQFKQPDSIDETPRETRAATPRFATAQARIEAALRSSADPLDRLVADVANVGDMRTPSGRDAAVVQQAVSTAHPRVYVLGYGFCASARTPIDGCQALSARGWAQLDPGNGTPWIELLRQARARGDAAGVQDAMSHLASETRYDTYLFAAAGAVAARVPEDAQELAAAGDLAMRALSFSATQASPPYSTLVETCRDRAGGNADLAAQCRTISDVMFDHSDSLTGRAIGAAVFYQATGDASRRELSRAERVAFQAHWSPATGYSECKVARESMKLMLRSAQVGEVESYREQSRKFVPP